MSKIVITLFLLSISKIVFCQMYQPSVFENLVPNPSFEDCSCIPTQTYVTSSTIPCVYNWYIPNNHIGSADYLHKNANNNNTYVNIPNNEFGTQSPRTGDAYVAIIPFKPPIPGHPKFNDGYAEYLQVQLKKPLLHGMQYRIKFYVSHADYSLYYNNCISAILTHFPLQTSQANYWGILNVPYTPQVIGGKFGSTYNLFTNDNGWDLIENTFIAQGGEQYLTIGVFDRINGQKVHVPVIGDTTWLPEAYYYIDDVSITEEPYCLHSCKINLPAIVLDPDPNQQIQSMACIPNVHPMSIQIDNAIAYRLTIYNSFGAPLYNFYEFNPNGFPYPWFVNWNGEDDYGNGVQSDLYAATLEMWNCNAGGTMINFHIYSNGFNGQPVHIPPVTDIPFNSGFSCCEYDKYYQDYIFNWGVTYRTDVVNDIWAGENVTTGPQGDVIVSNGSDVTFVAGNNIYLEPGFKVQSGALFRAWIGYCGSSHKVNSNSTVQKQYNFASVYSTDSILFVNSSYDNHINISIFSSKVSSGLVEIFDCTGKKLLEQNCSFSIGINKVAVHKNNIANGNYICKVVFGSGLFDSKKIIITNE